MAEKRQRTEFTIYKKLVTENMKKETKCDLKINSWNQTQGRTKCFGIERRKKDRVPIHENREKVECGDFHYIRKHSIVEPQRWLEFEPRYG